MRMIDFISIPTLLLYAFSRGRLLCAVEWSRGLPESGRISALAGKSGPPERHAEDFSQN